MTDITLKTGSHFKFTGNVELNDITLCGKQFETREYGGRMEVDLSTRLSTSTFLQWNNETNEVNVNFRLHYIPKIGSDIYIVYNRLMDEDNEYRTLQNAGMLKMNYMYRF